MSLPLEGVKVLDLSRLLPGGFCSLLLADFGAEVLKVEDVNLGDYVRWAPPKYVAGAAASNPSRSSPAARPARCWKKSVARLVRHRSRRCRAAALRRLVNVREEERNGFVILAVWL